MYFHSSVFLFLCFFLLICNIWFRITNGQITVKLIYVWDFCFPEIELPLPLAAALVCYVFSYCLMHGSVTFQWHLKYGITVLWLIIWPCLTARVKQWTMHPVAHPPTGRPPKSTGCLACFSLLFGKGAYPMKH